MDIIKLCMKNIVKPLTIENIAQALIQHIHTINILCCSKQKPEVRVACRGFQTMLSLFELHGEPQNLLTVLDISATNTKYTNHTQNHVDRGVIKKKVIGRVLQ